MNGADLLAECLQKQGVKLVTGFSGRTVLPLLKAFEASGIRCYQTRHEQGAGFMADGYSRVSNLPGVVLVQRGPGVTNCVTAIANAQIDSVPLLVLIGQGEMEMFGKGALQELDHLAFLPYFTKWSFRVPTVSRIPEVIRRAFTLLNSGKPGPVALELPMNLMERPLEGESEEYAPVAPRIRVLGDPRKIAEAVELLETAKFPLIYAGAGVLRSEATQELLQLVESLGLPVMTSLGGKSAFPETHELSLGIGGFPRATYGTKQAHHMLAQSDCVFALGTSFKEHGTRYFLPMPTQTKLIHVDIAEDELGKNYPPCIGILGDLKRVLSQMCEISRGRLEKDSLRSCVNERRQRLVNDIRRKRDEWLSEWGDHLHSRTVPIDPYRITTELMNVLDPRGYIILHDAGLVRAYICHHFISQRPGSFVGFGGFSAMGYSIPASIGAKLAAPDKDVVTIVGDGSFGMTGFELETAVRYDVPTLTLVYNNHGLDAVRVLQRKRQEKEIWGNLGGNYTEIARGLGAYAHRITHPDEIFESIRAALGQEKPAVLEIDVMDSVPTPNYT